MNSDENIDGGENSDKIPPNDQFLIVGIGAAEGGVKAIQEFFNNVKEKSGVAYVVNLHLSSDYNSQLTALLKKEAKIPVIQVYKRIKIEIDNVYILPPNFQLRIEGSFIDVAENSNPDEQIAKIDVFFRMLADEVGSRALAIILSGAGANGSLGLKRIKECGGCCFVQKPKEAEYNEMSRSAISTGLVDEILSVTDIPNKILSYNEGIEKLLLKSNIDTLSDVQHKALRETLILLKQGTGHDFTNYKIPTIIRRIERRIHVHNLPDLPAYANFLKENKIEAVALMKDLLISVTNFFRDNKPFKFIEKDVIPQLFKGKGGKDQVRIWVAGCATGEEAYSFAMLCAEFTSGIIDAPSIQVIATDIDETAIAIARKGLYAINDASDVSPERLRNFFIRENNHYRIRKEIRQTVLFASHNVLKDSPFSQLDMVSCRNLLIYFNNVAKKRVIQTFHFSLNPGGFLVLGNSEFIEISGDLYSIYNRENHILKRQHVRLKVYPIPEPIPTKQVGKVEKNLNELYRNTPYQKSFEELHLQSLEEYAPPSLVVNEAYDIVHLTQRVGKYLQVPVGEMSKNLLMLIRPELQLKLKSDLHQVTARKSPFSSEGIRLELFGNTETLNIHLRPIFMKEDFSKTFILIIFESVSEEKSIANSMPSANSLEKEIIWLKDQLRSANEQHDFQSENMRATNEELQTINEELRSSTEELQSSAEELESSKEELQSMNEDLHMLNEELKIKIEETRIAKNNLGNIINSTNIGTIFLDLNFQIVLYTPAAASIFNLIPADNGRPLSDITNKLIYPDLLDDAKSVLEKVTSLEKEILSQDGSVYLVRLAPNRTDDIRNIGVILTLVNITQSKRADEALRKSEERLRVTLESAIDFVIINLDINGNIEEWSTGSERSFGYSFNEVKGKPIDIIFTERDRKDGIPQSELSIALTKGFAVDERWHLRKDGSTFYMSGIVRPIYNPDLSGFVKLARDMTSTQQQHEQLRISEERHRIALESAGMAAWDWNIEEDKVIWNEKHHKILGKIPDNEPKKVDYFIEFVHEEDRSKVEKALRHAVSTAGEFKEEFRIVRDTTDEVWVNGYGSTVASEKGHATRIVGVMLDITPQKLFTENLSKMVEERTVELKRSNNDLQQFAHVASHDLKEPVRKIRTFYSRIMDEHGDKLSPEVVSSLERIESAAIRMYTMIEGVLRYSKVGANNEPPQKVELNTIIDQIEIDLEVLISSKEARIIRQKLPTIHASQLLVYQLFYNLILNALKFSKADEPTRIEISTSNINMNNKNFLKITISDNGIGFKQKHAEKIFNTFTRLNSADHYEGSGLGLTLCKKIVERYEGTIFAESISNEGATFTILWPIID